MNPYYRDMALTLMMALTGMMLFVFCLYVGYDIYDAFRSGSWSAVTVALQICCSVAGIVAFAVIWKMLLKEW